MSLKSIIGVAALVGVCLILTAALVNSSVAADINTEKQPSIGTSSSEVPAANDILNARCAKIDAAGHCLDAIDNNNRTAPKSVPAEKLMPAPTKPTAIPEIDKTK